ncbi:3-hydroxyacyl-CoA dehydrogenase/enoyl-CoA hydratase family protein [Alicyclobacillus mali (ex Roth et al. 2021)]|uniref:3-hydroxyacyl-CoA dehydrogenase/enoyl-CoA hydratase family protein n=2 Tax=Alicyclobacillus mali (ex Roth et al. 2021) TaxID=1123961 RepID=UPI001A8DF7BF|nr:3-hydroxyacyl-CoA dehydrogenase/enoyl-CoA hydratase family protein [Alicyclobacillus mali (ex Roth et al. 2021)]
MRQIRRAAVIGSGVMGAQIAAHLANVGIPSLLLDLVPHELTADEQKKGLSLDHPAVRNRLATEAIRRLHKLSPAPLFRADYAKLITPGNLEDDLHRISEVDWVIEVIVESLEPKRQLLERIEQHWHEGMIVSTNTSGISINAMLEGRSEAFRRHFLGTHFFNPPRYMKLLEVIPGRDTDPAIVEFMRDFGTERLGKGVVLAKDTPNFIANRIGTYGLLVTVEEMQKGGFSVEEVDAITGPALGRPKSATFRTLDLVGIDTFVHVANNVRENVADPEEQRAFVVPEAIQKLVERGWLGEKSGQGFYKRVKQNGQRQILVLDLDTLEYREQKKITSSALEASKQARGAAGKAKALIQGRDKYAELAWNIVKRVLVYSAEKLGEIADTIQDIDAAMRWGFNWDLGPFELWDALGLVETAERMRAEGLQLPQWVEDWIAAGHRAFYEEADGKLTMPVSGKPEPVRVPAGVVDLAALKKAGKVIAQNSGASLIDLGDGVACLEFHSQNNAIGPDILAMIEKSVAIAEKDFAGLVVANQGKNFCVGANLVLILMAAQEGDWDEIDLSIRQFHRAVLALRYSQVPVVAAPHRMTLGGGVEVCLASSRVLPAAETYFGLVEVGVGVIPGGGGCKETARRVAESVGPDDDLVPALARMFQAIGTAKVSTSGAEALAMGWLRETDRLVVNDDLRISAAKAEVLRMAEIGYTAPPKAKQIRVAGRDGKATLQMAARGMWNGGYITDYDLHVAYKLAHVLAGGDVPADSLVSEDYLLDLEREAFLSLCGEPKTIQRMQHMLATGKPLRN